MTDSTAIQQETLGTRQTWRMTLYDSIRHMTDNTGIQQETLDT